MTLRLALDLRIIESRAGSIRRVIGIELIDLNDSEASGASARNFSVSRGYIYLRVHLSEIFDFEAAPGKKIKRGHRRRLETPWWPRSRTWNLARLARLCAGAVD